MLLKVLLPIHQGQIILICYFQCSALLSAVDESTATCIPAVNRPHEKKLPGWSELIKPYQEDAKFYYALWLSYGKPLNCDLHNAMKHYRNQYHFAIRRLKRNQENIKNQKLLDHCLNGNSTNLIKEFKKQNNSQTPKSTVIDGNSNDQSIADSFSEKYQKNDSTNNLLHEINVLDQSINDNNFVKVENLSTSVVYQALQSLKNTKNDNVFTFKSDALIHGADILVKYFTLLFQSFLIHGYVPSILSTSTLQPIIKDKLGNKSFLTTNECSTI